MVYISSSMLRNTPSSPASSSKPLEQLASRKCFRLAVGERRPRRRRCSVRGAGSSAGSKRHLPPAWRDTAGAARSQERPGLCGWRTEPSVYHTAALHTATATLHFPSSQSRVCIQLRTLPEESRFSVKPRSHELRSRK